MKSTPLLLVVLSLLSLSACTDVPSATQALSNAGYTNIKITGYDWTGCGQDDSYHTGFTAKGPTGQSVSGVVCGGVFKGNTIRTF